ncbi:MAG: hypothetical protein PGN13_00070 [Patulibacter minatonensis]
MRAPKLTYANVTASLALFVALGGTSYAVTQLPRNSVGSTQLKAGAVTSGKLAKGSVSADKLASGTVVTGPAGPRGPRGAEGPAGRDGATAVNSDVLIARRPNTVQWDTAGGSIVDGATLNLPAGSWLLDAIATINYEGATSSEWFTCSIQGPSTYASGTTRIGKGQEGVLSNVLPATGAVTLAAPADVTYRCGHPSAIDPPKPTVRDVVLRATRVASVSER